MENTPPLKLLNPEQNTSDFDSGASSEVYRIVPATEEPSPEKRESPTKRRYLELISQIVDKIHRPRILLFDHVSMNHF